MSRCVKLLKGAAFPKVKRVRKFCETVKEFALFNVSALFKNPETFKSTEDAGFVGHLEILNALRGVSLETLLREI